MRAQSVLLALGLLVALGAAMAEVDPVDESSVVELDAIVPPHPTEHEDEYLCTAVELPEKPMKLIGVESLSDQGTVHHMLLFGEEREGGEKNDLPPPATARQTRLAALSNNPLPASERLLLSQIIDLRV